MKNSYIKNEDGKDEDQQSAKWNYMQSKFRTSF